MNCVMEGENVHQKVSSDPGHSSTMLYQLLDLKALSGRKEWRAEFVAFSAVHLREYCSLLLQ